MSHRLDDSLLVTPALLERFGTEAEFEGASGAHFAFIQKSDGGFLTFPDGDIDASQAMFAMDILSMLNRELHHDGAWAIVFTNPCNPDAGVIIRADYKPLYGRFVFLWLDKDGDVKFPVECDEPMWEVLAKGPITWVQQCETAWALWKETDRVLDAQSYQQFRRAQGEVAPSLRA